jgi:hypothetical protein
LSFGLVARIPDPVTATVFAVFGIVLLLFLLALVEMKEKWPG